MRGMGQDYNYGNKENSIQNWRFKCNTKFYSSEGYIAQVEKVANFLVQFGFVRE